MTPTGDFDTIQHIELPESPIYVTEHRLAVYRDADGNLYVTVIGTGEGDSTEGAGKVICFSGL